MVSVKAGCNFLIEGGVWEEIACDLFDGKFIEWLVLVVSFDHPVAPTPHETWAVELVSIGVCESGCFEPRESHCFSIAGRGEEPIDGAFVSTAFFI